MLIAPASALVMLVYGSRPRDTCMYTPRLSGFVSRGSPRRGLIKSPDGVGGSCHFRLRLVNHLVSTALLCNRCRNDSGKQPGEFISMTLSADALHAPNVFVQSEAPSGRPFVLMHARSRMWPRGGIFPENIPLRGYMRLSPRPSSSSLPGGHCICFGGMFGRGGVPEDGGASRPGGGGPQY